MKNPLITYLQLLTYLSPEDQELISSAFVSKRFKEGDELFKPGHVCREFFFVCKGVLRTVVKNDKGANMTHFFLKENKFCTILNSFTNELIAEEGIIAACDTEVLAITRTRLMILYSEVPHFKILIDKITHQALLDKIKTSSAYLGQNSTMRYQTFMITEPDIAMRVALNDIASYLGITPQSLSRIRKNRLQSITLVKDSI